MKTSQGGLDLIKSFEGLRLSAYIDAVGIWTIGYGHTGPVAKAGKNISPAQAQQLLTQDVGRFENAVNTLIKVPLLQNEFDALVSFTFNVGEGALRNSTLRKRLNAGEDKARVFKEELPKWNKGNKGILPGLTRRREAEVKLATDTKTDKDQSFLERAAVYYTAEPHQQEALRWLEANLSTSTLEEFKSRYRGLQKPLVIEHAPLIAKFPLDVPYFYQRDSRTGHGERMCFSSSMAMAIEYLDPEAFDGDDDTYIRTVLQFGDTVSSEAQLKAAKKLGMQVTFRPDCSEKTVIEQLDEGIPVPMGILHKGSISNPSGGGHWICAIGYTDTDFYVHDPFGRLDLAKGGYPKAGPIDGKCVKYNRKELMKRFLIRSANDGWAMLFD